VEIPLPDRDSRRKLVDLYGSGLDVVPADLESIIDRTEGVTASFIKELLRKATLIAAEDGRAPVTGQDVSAALDHLLSATAALTRTLLGVRGGGEHSPLASPRAWLEVFPPDG